MALSTGTISMSQIAGEFGGTAPHSLSEYYGRADGIPDSGAISFIQFRGKSAFTPNLDFTSVMARNGDVVGFETGTPGIGTVHTLPSLKGSPMFYCLFYPTVSQTKTYMAFEGFKNVGSIVTFQNSEGLIARFTLLSYGANFNFYEANNNPLQLAHGKRSSFMVSS